MGGGRIPFPACLVAGKGYIEIDDIVLLRRFGSPNAICTDEEAVTLLALHRACPRQCPEWRPYLVESLAAFIAHGSEPSGAIDRNKLIWITAHMSKDGVVMSVEELEAILHGIDLAQTVCEELTIFCLQQMRLALGSDQDGAYGKMREPDQYFGEADMIYLWRLLRSSVERGELRISASQALVLEEIEDAISPLMGAAILRQVTQGAAFGPISIPPSQRAAFTFSELMGRNQRAA